MTFKSTIQQINSSTTQQRYTKLPGFDRKHERSRFRTCFSCVCYQPSPEGSRGRHTGALFRFCSGTKLSKHKHPQYFAVRIKRKLPQIVREFYRKLFCFSAIRVQNSHECFVSPQLSFSNHIDPFGTQNQNSYLRFILDNLW